VPLDQIGQDLEGLGPQRDLFAAAQQKSAFQVQLVIAKPVLADVALRSSSAAQAENPS
jgi:hypothetical protein